MATNKIRLYSFESNAAKYVLPIPVTTTSENRNKITSDIIEYQELEVIMY